jgi:hypothetical protein
VVIPVVFHDLVGNGATPVTLAEVQAQIDVLNQCFSKREAELQFPWAGSPVFDSLPSFNSGFKHIADQIEGFEERSADTHISFCLAQSDPAGAPTNGLTTLYTDASLESIESSAIFYAESGGQPAWNTRNYLNIWICDLRDEMSGFAQMPGGPEATDGIVIDRRFFGVKNDPEWVYREGKTLVHLIGNYLNLYPLWGDGTYLCSDDYVWDTPIHNAPNGGCVEVYRHISTCDGYPVEMTMNYMDNTDDACMYMFTYGQMMRMHASLTAGGYRNGLVDSSNLACRPPLPFTPLVTDRENDSNSTTTITAYGDKPFMRLYPNPTQTQVTLTIRSIRAGSATLVVFDVLGSALVRQELALTEGLQNLSLDCSDWASGLYSVRLQIGGEVLTERLEVGR